MEAFGKQTMIHIASEMVILGGISFVFHKRISELNKRISELEKELSEIKDRSSNDSDIKDEFEKLKKYTIHHITSIYSSINNVSLPPPTSTPTFSSQSYRREDNKKEDFSQDNKKIFHQQERRERNVSFYLNDDEREHNLTRRETDKIQIVDDTNDSLNEDDSDYEIDETKLDEELEDELKELESNTIIDTKQSSLSSLSPFQYEHQQDYTEETKETKETKQKESTEEVAITQNNKITPVSLEFVSPVKKTTKAKKQTNTQTNQIKTK